MRRMHSRISTTERHSKQPMMTFFRNGMRTFRSKMIGIVITTLKLI